MPRCVCVCLCLLVCISARLEPPQLYYTHCRIVLKRPPQGIRNVGGGSSDDNADKYLCLCVYPFCRVEPFFVVVVFYFTRVLAVVMVCEFALG